MSGDGDFGDFCIHLRLSDRGLHGAGRRYRVIGGGKGVDLLRGWDRLGTFIQIKQASKQASKQVLNSDSTSPAYIQDSIAHHLLTVTE